ncbi:MAG TPA: hypothetical protein VFM88_21090 [Vicinamibacteria bacterium]|nr:hypothetical protein [Vicinamibacteria bacterium]
MLARCASCGVRFVVPEDRARNPGLKVRCRCGAEFALHAPKPPRVAGGADAAVAAAAAPAPVRSSAAAPPPVAADEPLRSGAWRRCSNHPQVKSESVCPACGIGFCRDCEQRIRNVPVCPRCQGLCTDVAKVEEDAAREKQRARTMADDIGFIAAYPFSDPAAYVMLAVFTGFFSFFSGFAMGVILSKGVLVWYGFTALTKVSVGKFRGYMPNFGDITDIVHPMRLSFAAFLAAGWPLIAVWYFLGLPAFIEQARGPEVAVVHAQEPEPEPPAEEGQAAEGVESGEGAEDGLAAAAEEGPEGYDGGPSPVLGVVLFGVAALWYLLYMPMALIVAAISRGFFKTLNPLIGVEAIAKMGGAYWFAAGIYFALALVQLVLDRFLGLIPIAGTMISAFVAAYAWLATGCALGLAVFKKAKELNLD